MIGPAMEGQPAIGGDAAGAIRPVLPIAASHAAVLAAIHAQNYPPAERWSADAFARLLSPPLPAWGRLAPDGAGFALFRTVLDETELLAIAVAPARRRRGIGRALLDAGLRARPPGDAFLEVEATNAAAIGLYRAAGFERVGRRAAYYGPGRDALLMRACAAAGG